MYGTGMQNPIFGMMNSMQLTNNQGMSNQNSGMQNMMNNPMMNNMGNSQMGNPMMMNNPMMNNMNNMNNMMNMAQMSQHLQNQYQNQLQNMASNSQFQNQDMTTPSNSNYLTIIFRTSSATDDKPIKIQCTSTDLVSDVIDRYRAKSEDKDRTKKFIFNAKELDQTKTVGEAGLTEGSNIFVVTTQGIYGA